MPDIAPNKTYFTRILRPPDLPHQAFCDDPSIGAPYVRWAFCKRTAVIEEALHRLDAGLR